jgi:sodium-dependent dicarboxylate transporter 2/3/5
MGNTCGRVKPNDGCDVFLGGSCNPTTWRTDIAIPMLEAANLTYYNPQVDAWHAELAEVERVHKKTSRFNLFVIDNQTRAIASIQEASLCIGRGDRVVVVIKYIPEDHPEMSKNEIDDLNRGRLFLAAAAQENNIPLFLEEKEAIKYIIKHATTNAKH